MSKPWTKKTPYLSLWLSGANAVAGAARAQAASCSASRKPRRVR